MEDKFILTQEKYKKIGSAIFLYGISVANISIESFNALEMYEESFMVTESIKRYCKELGIKPIFETKDNILKNYQSEFWRFGYSGEYASEKLHIYFNSFIKEVQEATKFNENYLTELYEYKKIL